ncbi:GYF domain-containing protein [Rubripirellula sp.]|nr:GYF domain-containing protein [Rubripirellula sp.]MDB4339072.1 GYF domain-containing protein [Rubripirellula sp.]
MTNWFVQSSGADEETGPYRPSELLDLVRSGDVTPESMLRKDDSGWFAAADVGGLFEAAMRPTIRYFCPNCHLEISEPPINCPKCDFNVIRADTEIRENSIASRDSKGATESRPSSVKNWLNRKKINPRSGNSRR